MLDTVTVREDWRDKDNQANQWTFGGVAPASGLNYEKSGRLQPAVEPSLELAMVLYMVHNGAGRHES